LSRHKEAGLQQARIPRNASVFVTGGTQPYSWSVASGALPASLALNPASGTISRMPSTAGNSSFTVKVNDATGLSAQQPLAYQRRCG
jgi:hypothetical protein